MPGLNDISIVIPVSAVEAGWKHLHAQLLLHQVESEVIFSCATAQKAEELQQVMSDYVTNYRVIHAPAGRATQMNAGADAASKPWLWFLHADSQINASALEALKHVKLDHKLGYFDLRFINDGPRLMAINAFGVWFRSRFFKLPFGDQGFVLSKTVFDECGRYRTDLDAGEDHALVWSLKQKKFSISPIGASIGTSARKYASGGWWATTRAHLRATWQQARRYSAGSTQ